MKVLLLLAALHSPEQPCVDALNDLTSALREGAVVMLAIKSFGAHLTSADWQNPAHPRAKIIRELLVRGRENSEAINYKAAQLDRVCPVEVAREAQKSAVEGLAAKAQTLSILQALPIVTGIPADPVAKRKLR